MRAGAGACACVQTGVSGESCLCVAGFERFRALGFEVADRVEIFPTPTTVLTAPSLLSGVFEVQSETGSASPATCVQGLAERWALGCVNSPPAARGSQEAGLTQPREPLLADPCTYAQSIPDTASVVRTCS